MFDIVVVIYMLREGPRRNVGDLLGSVCIKPSKMAYTSPGKTNEPDRYRKVI